MVFCCCGEVVAPSEPLRIHRIRKTGKYWTMVRGEPEHCELKSMLRILQFYSECPKVNLGFLFSVCFCFFCFCFVNLFSLLFCAYMYVHKSRVMKLCEQRTDITVVIRNFLFSYFWLLFFRRPVSFFLLNVGFLSIKVQLCSNNSTARPNLSVFFG